MPDDAFHDFNNPQDDPTGASQASGGELMPQWARTFLELLIQNGSVSMSARLVGMSRSTVYKLAHRSPSFRRALDEAKLEFRDLLLGEAHKRAIQNQSDTILRTLLGLYFPQAVDSQTGRARIDPTAISDEEIDQVAAEDDRLDLSGLTDEELVQLDNLLARASGSSPS